MAGRGHGRGTPLTDPWGLDPELQEHIQQCPCQCNHLGYGNFLDYQIPPCPRELPVRETTFNIIPHSYQNGRSYHQRQGYRDFDYQLTPLESCSCSTDSLSSRNSLRGPWCVCFVVCVIIATLSAGLGLPLLNPVLEPHTLEERLEVVQRILKEVPLVDGHNDLPWNLRKFMHNRISGLNLSSIFKQEPWSKSKWAHTDLPRLKAGLLGAQFWSAYVPCKSQHLDAVQLTLEQIDVIKRLVDLNSDHFGMVESSSDIVDIHREGKIASIIAVEGGHSLGNSLAVLRTFYNLGARLLTITHSCDTPWGKGAKTRDVDGGLSAFGRSVIREMNRLGMIVDLSHTSINTAKAALNASHAPVIFSHSAAYTLCNSTRNVPDDVLKLVALNGGVVMVNFYTLLVTCNDTATMQDVIKHINHIRAVAGVDHVGIGAGYDGINMTPSGLEDVSTYPNLFAELLADPDWSVNDLKLLAGLNLLRVFAKVEAVRDHWKLAAVLPGEDVPIPYIRHPCSSLFS